MNTGINTPGLVHQVTYTLLPDADICVLKSTVCHLLGMLIIFVLRVFPPSALERQSVSLLDKAIYRLDPEGVIETVVALTVCAYVPKTHMGPEYHWHEHP
jgi:hypothetical protein